MRRTSTVKGRVNTHGRLFAHMLWEFARCKQLYSAKYVVQNDLTPLQDFWPKSGEEFALQWAFTHALPYMQSCILVTLMIS